MHGDAPGKKLSPTEKTVALALLDLGVAPVSELMTMTRLHEGSVRKALKTIKAVDVKAPGPQQVTYYRLPTQEELKAK